LPACAHCTTDFPTPPFTRGKPQRFCGKVCQTRAANARRASTRAGRIQGDLSTSGKTPGQPVAPGVTIVPPKAKTPLSDAPNARLDALMALAHSPRGIDAWQLAELAKLRGISPWAPARVIMAREVRK
jgi:hypothetical protein